MTRIELFRREIDVFIEQNLSERGRAQFFVSYAEPQLANFEGAWMKQTRGRAKFDRFVDGRPVQSFAGVTSAKVFADRVRMLGVTVDRALQLFDIFTKVVTGDYRSHTKVFSGGALIAPAATDKIPSDAEVVIVNLSPFALKAERRSFNDAEGSGFKNGLFESIAAILKSESLVPVRFSFVAVNNARAPAIVIGGRDDD